MKFTVEKKEISEALNLVASVAEKRQSIPILSNILLKAEKTGLTLIATDLEIELTSPSYISLEIADNVSEFTANSLSGNSKSNSDSVYSVNSKSSAKSP